MRLGCLRGFDTTCAPGSSLRWRRSKSRSTKPRPSGAWIESLEQRQLLAASLISQNVFNTGTGSGSSESPVLSADGRYVAFVSTATLTLNTTIGGVRNIFLRDRQSYRTTLVSVDPSGQGSGNGDSTDPVLTPDGRYLLFTSRASNLVAGSSGQALYLRDLQTNTTRLVSTSPYGAPANGDSGSAVLSPDGRYVAFQSYASNLVSYVSDTNSTSDIFVRDMKDGGIIAISVNASGLATGNGVSTNPSISRDGRYVCFTSAASNLISGDLNGVRDVFRYDLLLGKMEYVSTETTGQTSGNNASYDPVMSADGRYIAFASEANNLASLDMNGLADIYLRDMSLGKTTLLSGARNGTSRRPVITPDGRHVLFESSAPDLVSGLGGVTSNEFYLRDVQGGTTRLVTTSVSNNGVGGSDVSLSDDGRYVAFASRSGNLVSGLSDGNFAADVFVRDMRAGRTRLVSSNVVNIPGNRDSGCPRISADGSLIAFESLATDLVANDANGQNDVYAAALPFHTRPPSAILSAPDLSTGGASTCPLTIAYDDEEAVDFASLDGGDLRVTGPNGFEQLASFSHVDISFGGKSGTAHYLLSAPGGTWDAADNGTYTVWIEPEQVMDTSSNPMLRQVLGTFTVRIAGVTVSVADASASESEGVVNFVVRLWPAPQQAVRVSYATADGSAKAGEDYQPISGTLVFAAGQTSQTLSVSLLSDTIDEADEGFSLNLSNPVEVAIERPQVGGLIRDDDPPPTVSIRPVSVVEGSGGATQAAFAVELSSASTLAVSVAYATLAGSAQAGSDFDAASGRLEFAAGQISKTLLVAIKPDTLVEPSESFTVRLSAPINCTLANEQALGSIQDDDVPLIAIADVSLAEADPGEMNMLVSLSLPSYQAITVNWTTVEDPAAAHPARELLDFTPSGGTLSFPPGLTSQFIPIRPLVLADNQVEETEAFYIRLAAPLNAAMADDTATVNIQDSPVLPGLRIDDAVVGEDQGGGNLAFTVSLSSPSPQAVAVRYVSRPGTATADADHTPVSGLLIFPPGTSSQSVRVPIQADLLDEEDETVFVDLLAPTNAFIADGRGIGTIGNDDAPPSIRIADVLVVEGQRGRTIAPFKVRLSAPSGKTISVQYATADGSSACTSGTDYTFSAGTLSFAPGQVVKTIKVPIAADALVESDEIFYLRFLNPGNAVLVDARARAIIKNDDGPGLRLTLLGPSTHIEDGQREPVNFGTFHQGDTAALRTFRLSNSGNATLQLGPVRLPAGYELLQGPGAVLRPGQFASMVVKFSPVKMGKSAGQIRLATNLIGKNSFNFPVMARVIASKKRGLLLTR